MDDALNWVWQGCLIALLTMAVLQLMERTRAQARYAVCWLALAAIALLPALPSGPAVVPDAFITAGASVPTDPIFSVPVAPSTSTAAAAIAAGLWLVFAAWRFAVTIRATRRTRAGCTPFPSDLEARLHCWNAMRHRGRPTRIVLSAAVRAAAVLGGGRPLIAVSPALLARLTADELDRVVIHEWAHVQRRDDLASIAQGIVRLVAGWHPAVWWVERRMLIEREVACDEMAVAVVGCAKSYAACLTTIAAIPAGRREPLGVVGVLSTPALTLRVMRILSRHRLASPASSAGAAACAVLMLTACALALSGHRLVGTTASAAGIEPPAIDTRPSTLAADGAGRTSSVAPAARNVGMAPGSFGVSPGSFDVAPVSSDVVPGSFDVVPGSSDVAPGSSDPGDRQPSPASGREAGPQQRPTAPQTPVPDAALPSPRPHASNPANPGDATAQGRELRVPTLMPLDGDDVAVPVIDKQPLPPPGKTAARESAPWTAVADAGVSVGRGSQQAGVATARLFTRFGRKIAGSF